MAPWLALVAGAVAACGGDEVAPRSTAEQGAVPAPPPPAAPAADPDAASPDGDGVVGPVPPALRLRLGLAAFHAKHLDAGGVPVLGSPRVRDEALHEARYVVLSMIGHRPDLLNALRDAGVRVVVMAPTEFTTDVPEHADLRPAEYWDTRARGLGATAGRPAVSCGEENLLAYRGDPYARECILVHEFAHTLHLLALPVADPTFDVRLRDAYADAMARHLWERTYASKDVGEYWAEGVQSWFDTNTEDDEQHNHVDTRAELATYDRALADLCAEVFGDRPWRWLPPGRRRPPSARAAAPGPEGEREFSWSARTAPARTGAEAATGEAGTGSGAIAVLRPEAARERWASAGSHDAAVLHLRSRVRSRLDVAWIDFDGAVRPWVRLDPLEIRPVQTFVGHVFRVASADGGVLGYAVVTDPVTTITLEGSPRECASVPVEEAREELLLLLEAGLAKAREESESRERARSAEQEAILLKAIGTHPATCDWQGVPFLDAVRDLAERHGVRITVEEAALPAARESRLWIRFRDVELARLLVTMGALSGTVPEVDGKGVRFRNLP